MPSRDSYNPFGFLFARVLSFSSMSEGFEETQSGFRKKGDWKEIAEFGEELEKAMEEAVDQASLKKFREWRPKKTEAENDMKKKTVEEAVVRKRKIEEETKGVRGDLKDAGGKVAEAGKNARKPSEAEKELKDASEEAARPFISDAVKLFRRFESLVYSKLSLRGNRYYLDTEEFSVDVKSHRSEYEIDVNVPEEDPRRALKQNLEDSHE